jgi:hypothetical protein
MVETRGIEPLALSLRTRCSPAELHPRNWWTVRDSNSLPPQCHRGALPIELTARSCAAVLRLPGQGSNPPRRCGESRCRRTCPIQGRDPHPCACGHDRPYCRPVRSAHLVAERSTDARDGIRASRSTRAATPWTTPPSSIRWTRRAAKLIEVLTTLQKAGYLKIALVSLEKVSGP